jgi:mevalonate kinase
MRGKAHGKIIVIGEHSVVYGHLALSVPVSQLSTICTLEKSDVNHFESTLYSGKTSGFPTALEPIRDLIETLQRSLNIKQAFTHFIESNIPIDAGFGSSAALALAVVRAYDAQFSMELSSHNLFEWVQYFERLTHDTPSGIDALSVIHDTPWLFSKTDKRALSFDLNAYLVIADTLERTPTKKSVKSVASLKHTASFYPIMNHLGDITQNAYEAMMARDINALGKYMNQSMDGLRTLNLSTNRIDAFTETALVNGAKGAKLTGGGMGGCIIALCDTLKAAKSVEHALITTHNAPTWITKF